MSAERTMVTRVRFAMVLEITAPASRSSFTNAASNDRHGISLKRHATVATRSMRAGAINRPRADATPALGGQITRLMPSLRATSQPCSGPPPPVASNAKSPAWCPRSATCTRAAAAMFSFTTEWMPQAVSSTLSRDFFASGTMASRASVASIVMVPPAKVPASR